MPRKTYRKVITSPENLVLINPENKKLQERFLKEKNTRCSDGTIVGYESDLNIFFTWNLLNNDNKFYADIEKIELADFFSYAVSELQWGSSRFGRVRSALSGMSDFIEKFYDKKYPLYRNIVLKAIELMPKVAKREKTVLSEKQVDSLFNYLKNDLNKPQEACLLAIAISSGARISEWLRFTVSIIDENNEAFDGLFIETLKEIKTKGRTKQGHMMTKFLIKDIFLPYYKDWLVIREQIMKENNQEHDYIFIKSDGSPAQLTTIRSWMEKWEVFLGVPYYPHCLRHYIVSYLTRLGLSSDFIVAIMGWKTSTMYEVYNDVTAKERKWKDLGKLKEHLDKKSEVEPPKEENDTSPLPQN
jgi:site-specific recombinase XerD